MSKGMLGELSLSNAMGPINELLSRLAGNDGLIWLNALKRFLRKEDAWMERGSQCRIKASILIGSSTYEKVFDLPIAPFIGMTFFDTNIGPGSGWGDPLYVDQVYCDLSEEIPLTITFGGEFKEKHIPDLVNAGWKLTSTV